MSAIQKELKEKLENVPESILREVLDYLKYLQHKRENAAKKSNTALSSEKSLARDWLKPEEDEAWKDL